MLINRHLSTIWSWISLLLCLFKKIYNPLALIRTPDFLIFQFKNTHTHTHTHTHTQRENVRKFEFLNEVCRQCFMFQTPCIISNDQIWFCKSKHCIIYVCIIQHCRNGKLTKTEVRLAKWRVFLGQEKEAWGINTKVQRIIR